MRTSACVLLLLAIASLTAGGTDPLFIANPAVYVALHQDDDAGADESASQSETPPPTDPMPTGGPNDPFSRRWAAIALGRAADEAALCWRPGDLAGPAHVKVTYEPNGKTSNVVLDGPLAETPAASCVASAFRQTAVPQFGGKAITVGKSLVLSDPTADGSPRFDPEAAKKSLDAIDLRDCSSPSGPAGKGDVIVNFSPNGSAVLARVGTGPFTHTSVGACVESSIVSKARVPSFQGGVRWVIASFRVPEASGQTL